MSSPGRAIAFPELKRILLATDFSRCSGAALNCARTIAHACGSSIHVVHVRESAHVGGVLEWEAAHAAKTCMGRFLDRHYLEGLLHHASLENGPVAEVLTALIPTENIDLIALGTHGHRRSNEPTLGSVAQQLLQQARCPVLTVRESAETASAPGGISRIIYAADFSSGSLAALPYALLLARRRNAHLILLHVDTTEATFDWLNEAAVEERLRALVPHAVAEVCRIEPMIEIGPVAEQIVAVAADTGANLIVLGGHRTSTVSAAVVTEAHCPVLSVRTPGPR